MMKKNGGITLIALVVTVIVLLILAGISISMLTGQNGILTNAAKAKEQTEAASDLEYLQLKAYDAVTNYYASSKTGSENEYILEELGKIEGIETNVSQGTVKYKSKTYDVSEVIGNTNEQKAVETNGLKQITVANAEKQEDKDLLADEKVRMIVEEKTENPSKAIIPAGFYYVTGTPSTGLVISDKFGDNDSNSKGGNQFVWVPCNGSNGVTYEKEIGLATTWKSKYSGKSWWYNSYSSGTNADGSTKYEPVAENTWSDNGGNKDSVKKYGGFYIGRYEAGLPSNLYEDKDGATYERDSKKNIKSGAPVSKKNTPSWNFISQVNAVEVSNNMYSGSTSVTSGLVDSYAWDTIVEWMTKEEANKNLGNDSSLKGNYYNNDKINLSNALYAVHRYGSITEAGKKAGKGDYWSYATKYKKGAFKSGAESIDATSGAKYDFTNNTYDTTNYSYTIRKELATGSAEETKVKNIYDMAGNMWEWTTETGKPDGGSTLRAVLRGGSFFSGGSDLPVSSRNGSISATGYSLNIGFRVVLYIK